MRGFTPPEVGLERQAFDDGALRIGSGMPSFLRLNYPVDALNKESGRDCGFRIMPRRARLSGREVTENEKGAAVNPRSLR